jgi:hypothetical protein
MPMVQQFRRNFEELLANMPKPFGGIWDCRDLTPWDPDIGAAWKDFAGLLDRAGRGRTAAIVSKATLKMQSDRYVREFGLERTDRILLCCHEDWDSCPCLQIAEAWVVDGIEPEDERAEPSEQAADGRLQPERGRDGV